MRSHPLPPRQHHNFNLALLAAHIPALARRITWSVLSTPSNLSSSPPGEYLADSIRFVHSMWTSPSTPCGLLRYLQVTIEYLIWLIMEAHISAQSRVHMAVSFT